MSKKKRVSWVDPKTSSPQIDQYARQLDSFLQTFLDGVVDDEELKKQEAHLVELMKEIEPELSDDLHAKVTQLLCELTAYNIMEYTHAIQQARPKTKFQG